MPLATDRWLSICLQSFENQPLLPFVLESLMKRLPRGSPFCGFPYRDLGMGGLVTQKSGLTRIFHENFREVFLLAWILFYPIGPMYSLKLDI